MRRNKHQELLQWRQYVGAVSAAEYVKARLAEVPEEYRNEVTNYARWLYRVRMNLIESMKRNGRK